jgi:hypothetical protein
MWQLTWMLSFLPDWFWAVLFFSGIGAIVASKFLKLYSLPLKIGGAVAVVVSLWFMGAASNEEKWQVKIKEMEAKVAVAEEKSKEANTVIEEKVVTKTKVIKQKGDDIIKYIDREVVKNEEVIKYLERCPTIPKEIINAHNAAALMNQAAGDKK